MAEQFRRTDPRYDRRLEVEISTGETRLVAVTKNVSLGGMFVETMDPLPVGTAVQVRFKVTTQPDPIAVLGEVRWCEESGAGLTGMGIRFQGLRAREVWALNRFFQS